MPKYCKPLSPKSAPPHTAAHGVRPVATRRAPLPTEPSHLVDTATIAALLHVSKRQVQKMMKNRAVPFIPFGRRCVRFDPREVLDFVKNKYGIRGVDCDAP